MASEHDRGIKAILFDAWQIAGAVEALGAQISRDYRNKAPLLVSVLRGGLIFLADLMRQIDLPVEVDFMAISSYGPETRQFGVVQLLKDLDQPITGRDVLVVEDVIDTGLTLNYLIQLLRARRPASLQVCTLLDKSARRIADIPLSYKGFDLPDVFVVGYGLDYRQRYRNLPYLGVLHSDALEDV